MGSKLTEMEWPVIQLKVMSCRDLKASFNFFHKLSVYVVVFILDDDPQTLKRKLRLQRQKTPIDKDGNGHPEWNHLLHFDLKGISLLDPSPHLFLKFHLRCEGIIYGNKTIGEVSVSLKDLIDESSGAVRFLSYQVRTTDGKPNGVLNFSYKVIDNGYTSGTGSDPPAVDSSSGIHFPTERVVYPSLEDDYPSRGTCYPSVKDDYPSRGICYPSVEDDYPSRGGICYPAVEVHSPSRGITFPSQIFYHQTPPEFHSMTPPPPPVALYYCPPPQPYRYVLEARGPSGYPGVGQVERFDGDSWRLPTAGDGFPAL